LINNNRQQQQQGRRRGRRPQNGNSSGNRNENGSRIDSRARGNAPQMLEKYKNMARDAQLQGDRVMTEYYLQFSDHYFRIVAEQRARFEETRRPREDWQEGDSEGDDQETRAAPDSSDFDDDDGGEREPYQQPRRDARPPVRDRAERNDRQGNDRQASDRQANDRQEGNRDANRDRDGNRDSNRDASRDTNRDDRPAAREDRGNNRNRNTANRDGNRDTNRDSNRDSNRDYANRGNSRDAESIPDTIDIAVLPPSFASDGPITPIDITPIDDVIPPIDEAPAAPKRRGRPKKVEVEAVEG
jgi:Domain of unknown function (DUF4167)